MNRCQTLIFEDRDNRNKLVTQNRMGYKTAISEFFKFGKFWKFGDFFHILFFAKNPQKFQMFKNRIICTRQAPKECMYQFSSNSLHKQGFYNILNVKNGYFSGHLDVIQCNTTYSNLFRFLCNKRCSKVIFRVLDENRHINLCCDAKWPKSAI